MEYIGKDLNYEGIETKPSKIVVFPVALSSEKT